MSDMTAFERQLSGEVTGLMGPEHPVDDAAIFTAITTTQSPKWRFQSMFSATKFVVAGVIVALFGGFLLSGVLMQPSDEQLPAVGASASAQPVPTDAMTTEPEPTAEVNTNGTTTTPDLLPSVDLVTEEVEPGVYRVVSDGVRDLSGRVHDVAVSADGEVWLELGTSKNWSVVRLGEPGASRTLLRQKPWTLGLTSDGVPVVASNGRIKMLDGEAWAKAELTAYDECVLAAGRLPIYSAASAVGADGGCWTDDQDGLARIDADGSHTAFTYAEIGLEPDQRAGQSVVAPDGTIWIDVYRRTQRFGIFEGLLAYDGSTWSFIPYDGDDAENANVDTAVDTDGVYWLSRHVGPGVSPVLSWDGESWRAHPLRGIDDERMLQPVQPLPNGIVWFGSTATRWDGTALDVVEPAVPWGEGRSALASAPDGSAWTVVEEQLYVITSEAVAATE